MANDVLVEGDVILWNRDPCTVVGFRADGMLLDVMRHCDGQVLCLPRNPVDHPLVKQDVTFTPDAPIDMECWAWPYAGPCDNPNCIECRGE